MTQLKRGQHYDDPVAEARALIGSIRKHLEEERCNHSLREIVEDGLKQ
jgi:hypothetical protein